jgi:multidrug resistance efflux pump
MTSLRRLRLAFFALGVLLVVGMLLGAGLLSPGSGGGSDPAQKTAAPANGKNGTGPVVIGYVDSEPSPVPYGLPPVLQSGTVAKVFVKQFQEVKPDDPLYKFDTTLQEATLESARKAVGVANAKWEQAKGAAAQHALQVAAQKQAVAAAELKVVRAQRGYHLYETNLRDVATARHGRDKPDKIEAEVANDPKRFELESAYLVADVQRNAEKATLAALESAKENVQDKAVAEAEAVVNQAQAEAHKAQVAIDLCTVRAREAGTVERISISGGTVVGVSTREPALILVPTGSRIVRAEVEAEFAHKVGPDKKGKEVTIYDHADAKLTYKGIVREIGTTFLPKRGGGDGLLGNDTRVLEVVVEVTDPSPPGKPPLRVGQKVRVNFGQ